MKVAFGWCFGRFSSQSFSAFRYKAKIFLGINYFLTSAHFLVWRHSCFAGVGTGVGILSVFICLASYPRTVALFPTYFQWVTCLLEIPR